MPEADRSPTLDPARRSPDALAAAKAWAMPVAGRVAALLPQLSRYTVVSAMALGLDFAVYMMLVEFGWRASLAGALGYVHGLLLHFALSTRIVFDSAASQKSQMRLFVEFAASGLVGLALTAFVIAVATEILHLGALPAKGAAVVLSFLAVFLLRRSVVFASRHA